MKYRIVEKPLVAYPGTVGYYVEYQMEDRWEACQGPYGTVNEACAYIQSLHVGPSARHRGVRGMSPLCWRCEERPVDEEGEACDECAERASIRSIEDGECFCGGEAAAFETESQARIQRELK